MYVFYVIKYSACISFFIHIQAAAESSSDAYSLRKIVKHAAHLLQQQQHKQDDDQLLIEEKCLLQAVWTHFDSRLVKPHRDRLNDILQAHYPNSFSSLIVEDEKALKEAIESEITTRHLQCTAMFVNKVGVFLTSILAAPLHYFNMPCTVWWCVYPLLLPLTGATATPHSVI